MIATLPWAAIVTTNLDTLLEDALEQAATSPVIVDSEEDLPRIGLSTGPLIIKMHGSATRDEGQILTRFEYLDFQQTRRAMQAIVLTLFSQFPVLVVGAGLTDPNFLAIYGIAESALHRFKRPTFYLGSGVPQFVKEVWRDRRMEFIDVPHSSLTEWLEDLAKQVRSHQHTHSARKARSVLDRFLKEAALINLGKDLGDYRALQQRYLEQVHIPDYGWFTEPWDTTLYKPLRMAVAKALSSLNPQQRAAWSMLYVAPGPHAPLFADPEAAAINRHAKDLANVYLLDILPGVVAAAKENVRERLSVSVKTIAIIADLTAGVGDSMCRLLYNMIEQHDTADSILAFFKDADRAVDAIIGQDITASTGAAIADAFTTPEGSVDATLSYSEMVASFSLTAPVMSFRSVLYERYGSTASRSLLEDIMAALGVVWCRCNEWLFNLHLELLARATKPGGLVLIAMDTEKRFDDSSTPSVLSVRWAEPPLPATGLLRRETSLETSFMWRDHSAGFRVAVAGVPVADFLSHEHQIRVFAYTRLPENAASL